MHDLDSLRVEHTKLQEDQKRLTMMLFEKTKAWEKEISANDKESGFGILVLSEARGC